jgi:hypothetical protein
MPRGVYIKTEEHKRKIKETLIRKGIKPNISGIINYWLGRKRTYKNPEERNRKIGLKMKGTRMGEKHPRWIEDRTQLKQSEKKWEDYRYRCWSLSIKERDVWKCKINNSDCNGKLESHHILDWKNYPELRYDINNGITLCHAHHPRGREREAKLSPYLQSLVAERK